LHLKLIETGETRTIAEPLDLKGRVKWSAAVWYPDSARFLVNAYPAIEEWNEWSSAASSIWAVSTLGGEPTKLRDHATVCSVSPDASTISFATNRGKHGESEVWLMDANGGQARRYFEAKPGTGVDCWGWSPDGKYYGWVLNQESGASVVSQKIAGGPVVTMIGSEELKEINDITWLHDGRILYDRAEPGTGVCNYWIGRIDPDTGKRLEQPRHLTNWPSFCVSSGSATLDDKKVAFDAWSGFLTTDVGDLQKGGRLTSVRHFAEQESDAFVVGWTPDSKSLIIGQHPTPGNIGLYKQSLDSQTPELFLAPVQGGGINYGVVTPDGKWLIAFIWRSRQPTSGDRFVVPFPVLRFPMSGGAAEQVMQVSRPVVVSCPKTISKTCVIAEESDDRKQMIVSALDPIKGHGPELARLDLGAPVDWSLENFTWVISPDGTQLAVVQNPEGTIEIHPLHGGAVRKIKFQSSGIIDTTWAADQKGLFLTRRAPGGNELLYLDLQGHVQSLRKCTATNACYPFPSPDGHHLAILDRRQIMNMWMMENF
jgi:Tol biopolymer transport system component